MIDGLRARRAPLRPDHRRTPAAGAAELGDELPVAWRHRDERYAEKLATPDTSVADLIGDVDPMKVAEGRTPRRPGDHPLRADPAQPPRHRRDQRAARPRRADPGGDAQRDGGARHPDPRLRAAAAARRAPGRQRQPRGLHQPRPDHHPAQGPLRRRDPHPLPARARRRGRGHPAGGAPGRRGPARPPARDPGPVHPGAARVARAVDQRSGVSARFAIAGAETVAAAALRRATAARRGRGGGPGRRPRRRGRRARAARSSSRPARRAASSEILDHLLRTATAETVRGALPRHRPRARSSTRIDGRRHW